MAPPLWRFSWWLAVVAMVSAFSPGAAFILAVVLIVRRELRLRARRNRAALADLQRERTMGDLLRLQERAAGYRE